MTRRLQMTNQEALDVIKNLFVETKISTPINGELTIYENGRQATLREIHLKNTKDCFIVKYDECGFMNQSTFKPDHPSLFKACDAIVFCINKGSPCILFCELKSSKPNKSVVSPQLNGGLCFFECLSSILKNHHNCEVPFSEWKKYFFVFYSGASVQKRTIQKNQQIQSTATRPAYISTKNAQAFYLQQLLEEY